MASLKKHLVYVILGVAATVSLGMAGWAYVSGDVIVGQLGDLDRLRSEVSGQASSPQNDATIKAQKETQDRINAEQETLVKAALSRQSYNSFEGQERRTLVADVLPVPKSSGARIAFREAYRLAFGELFRKMKARGPATAGEIAREQALLDSKNQPVESESDRGPWLPQAAAPEEIEAKPDPTKKVLTLVEVLRGYAKSRAAELKARTIYMYVEENAFDAHPMIESDGTPTPVEIWHAQMTLWIEQDFAEAIVRVNEKRAEKLKAEGRAYDCWVANMPVKHLKLLASQNWLGRGGAMNVAKFARGFTAQTNDATRFILPLQLKVVIEEASLMDFLESLCGIGFYTPTRVEYSRVSASPLQDEFIYGEAPVVEATIDLEAYYFRRVYDAFIPKELVPTMARPEAEEEVIRR